MSADKPVSPKTPLPRPRRRSRIKRILIGLGIAIPVVIIGMWIAVNTVPWFGAWLADTLRAIIGTEAVAWLEQTGYDLQDRWNQLWHKGDKPKQYWDTPPKATSGVADVPGPPVTGAPSATPATPRRPDLPPFKPADVGSVFSYMAADGDGVWVPVALPTRPDEPTLMFKTLVHPDAKRPWAELFVVAMDLRRVDLTIVAGTKEPRATTPDGRDYKRTGLIPAAKHAELLAAFNGGFKEEHGHYGMKIDGITLVKPVGHACAIVPTDDGSLRIGPWKVLGEGDESMTWWRQTPPCFVDENKLHPWITDDNTNWGAAIGGVTIIRRSALALNKDRSILYMGLSNATGPRAIAVGMQHVGAHYVAQLDINYSYPRFVLFQRGESGDLEATGLFPGFSFESDEYLRDPSERDFFYVTLK